MSINKVILVGRLGKDPEVKIMSSGESVSNVTLATFETFKDKTGVKQEKTEWHNLVLFRRLAEISGEYLKKGAQIYVEGKLQSRKWQDKEGRDRYITEIVVSVMQMISNKSANPQAKQDTHSIKSNDDFEIPFGDSGGNTDASNWAYKDSPF